MNAPFTLARDWVQRHTFHPEDADDFAAWFIDFFSEELNDPALTYEHGWDVYRRLNHGDRG